MARDRRSRRPPGTGQAERAAAAERRVTPAHQTEAGSERAPAGMQTVVSAAAPWVISALGAALRFYRLDREPFWFDEAYTALSVQLPVAGILERLRGEGNAPLYYFVMHVWSGLFGDGEYAFRFVSALLGALTVPLVYWIGARMFSRRAALIAAGFAAISPLHIHYSQEARMYPLVPPFALAALYALYRLLVAPTPWALIGYALALLGGLYTQYYFLFFLPLAAGAVCATDRWRSLLFTGGALALVALGFAPWIPSFIDQASNSSPDWIGSFWRDRSLATAVPWSLQTLGPGGFYPGWATFKFMSSSATGALSLALAALVVVGAAVQLLQSWTVRAEAVDSPRSSPLRRGSGQASRRHQKTAAPAHEPEADPANEFAATKGTKSPCGDSPRPTSKEISGRWGAGSPRRWAWCSCCRGFNRQAKRRFMGTASRRPAGRVSQGERNALHFESNESCTVRAEVLEACPEPRRRARSSRLPTAPEGDAQRPTALALTLAAVLVPLCLACVVSLLRRPVYVVARYDLIAWGAYCLLAGAVLSRLRRAAMLAAVALWIGVAGVTLWPYLTTDRPKRNYADQGNRIAQMLVQRARPGESVIFTAATRTMTQYYLRGEPERFRLMSYPLGTDAHLGWIDTRLQTDPQLAAGEGRRFAAWLVDESEAPAVVWVVAPQSRGTAPLLAELKARGYVEDRARSAGFLLCLRRAA